MARPTPKRKSPTNVVEQLNMLRSFVGASSLFGEHDLSTCLRQSGYRVEVAAERLMTGQFVSSKKKPRLSSSPTSMMSSCGTNANHTPQASSSTSPDAGTITILDDDDCDVPVSGSSAMTPQASTVQPPATAKPTPVTPKTPALTTPAKMAVATPTIVSTHHSPKEGDPSWWLMSERWISNAIGTTRNGRIGYQEVVEVEYGNGMKKKQELILFRGESLQGQFPKPLSALLLPLLNESLIRVTAHALMEDQHIPIGAQVPLSISIWLPNPKAFFDLFRDRHLHSAADSRQNKSFFASQKGNAKKSASISPPKQTKKQKATAQGHAEWRMDVAMRLLQWAHHGEELTFDETTPPSLTKSAKTTEDEEEILLSDTDTTPPQEDQEAPAWASEALTVAGAGGVALPESVPELDTPPDFAVDLRPYQRQALAWMTQREASSSEGNQQPGKEDETTEQLALLDELITKNSKTPNESQPKPSTTRIQCDCGPVSIPTEKQMDKDFAPAVVPHGNFHPHLTHPLWERRYLCNQSRTEALSFYVQPWFGVAVASPPPPPQPCRGGILADSMGLGKTVMLLALIQRSKQQQQQASNKTTNGPTLVVTPLSLLGQWVEEVASKTNLSCRTHYGEKRSLEEFDDFDVVVTTYGCLQGEYLARSRSRKGNPSEDDDNESSSGLLGQSWSRVILDEAHCIKNTATVASKACCMLQAEYRWCVSGTIIQNSLEDVYSLLKFLKHEPWCEFSFWNAAITSEGTSPKSLNRVRRLLTPIMLRRTKDSLGKDGKPILKLPPVETKQVMVKFTPAEQQFYDALQRKSMDVFQGYIDAGTASTSWFAIFSLLHRLRQTCDHVALTVKSHMDETEWAQKIGMATDDDTAPPSPKKKSGKNDIDQEFLDDLMGKFRMMQPITDSGKASDAPYAAKIAQTLNAAIQGNNKCLKEECPVCLDPINIHDSVITPCLHIFCKDCLIDCLRQKASTSKAPKPDKKGPVQACPDGPCPTCNETVVADKILRLVESDGKFSTRYLMPSLKTPPQFVAKREEDGFARQTLATAMQGSGTGSSKLSAILNELDKVWEEDPGSKVLIFSQFLGFLDLMEGSFKTNQIPFARLDGKLSLKERMSVLQTFGRDDSNDVAEKKDPKKGSVLLISMKAGGVGLNLVAANSVFIADPWWNVAVEDQCVDRVHRIGQKAEKVRVRKFYVSNSVEERMVELQKRKKSVATEILQDKCTDGITGSSAKPTLDDFKLLFRED